jgi:hypothetical protein
MFTATERSPLSAGHLRTVLLTLIWAVTSAWLWFWWLPQGSFTPLYVPLTLVLLSGSWVLPSSYPYPATRAGIQYSAAQRDLRVAVNSGSRPPTWSPGRAWRAGEGESAWPSVVRPIPGPSDVLRLASFT